MRIPLEKASHLQTEIIQRDSFCNGGSMLRFKVLASVEDWRKVSHLLINKRNRNKSVVWSILISSSDQKVTTSFVDRFLPSSSFVLIWFVRLPKCEIVHVSRSLSTLPNDWQSGFIFVSFLRIIFVINENLLDKTEKDMVHSLERASSYSISSCGGHTYVYLRFIGCFI